MISGQGAGPRPKKKRARNEVKVGAVKIRWYKLADGRTCLDLRQHRKTNQRPTFVDHAEAIAEAERIAIELNAGGTDSQVLTSADRAAYAWAQGEAARYGCDLTQAITEWAEARRRLAGWDGSLPDAASAGMEALKRPLHPIATVVAELISSKSAHELHGRYAAGLKRTGELISARFPVPIEHITAKQLQEYLDGRLDETGARVGALADRSGRPVGPRRRNNVLKELRQIWQFARARGYLPDRITEAGKVELIKRLRGNIGVITPAAMEIHLRYVSQEYLPWIVLNAFSGLRSEEIVLTKDASSKKDPLRWEDFDWEAREISVRAETAKTDTPRPVPILDNLYAWLAPWRDSKAKGPVCPGKDDQLPRPDNERRRFLREAKQALHRPGELALVDLRYPSNGYRHSYGSYRMAILRNMQELSYEMGNSVEMIKRNYNNPRTQAEAKAWFSIYPPGHARNVVQFDRKAS